MLDGAQLPAAAHAAGPSAEPRAETLPLLLPPPTGLHPFFDDRVNDLVDFKIYLDISGEPWVTAALPRKARTH